MKRVIQLLCLAVFLLGSCISEKTDDCTAFRNLTFKHQCLYNPDENFDHWICNDVVLYVYQDKKLKYIDYVLYEQIKGGKAYSYRKRCAGKVNIVALAVRTGGDANEIPSCSLGEAFDNTEFHCITRIANTLSFTTDLFLGSVELENDHIKEETSHVIPMKSACITNVIVKGLPETTGESYILVEGVMNRMNLHYQGIGEEAEVYAGLVYDANTQVYTTNDFGVLPSTDSQTVSISLYSDDTRLAYITTDEKAVAGGRITLEIDLGISIVVTVDGWEVYNASVQWM